MRKFIRKFFVLVLALFVSSVSFGAVRSYVDAYFSTSIFQNVDDPYLRSHFGPYQYGYQYGDNRIYLRDTRLSFIWGLGVKQEGLFGGIELYANSFMNGYTMIDINDGQIGYMDDFFTFTGFFKSRAIRLRNVPSEMFFNFMPSLNLFSSTFSKSHWFVPYFVYPVEFIDGSVEVFTTADGDTTNLVKFGKDYYGIYGSYYDGIIDVEGFFAKNIYSSIGSFDNFSNFVSSIPTGNYGGIKLGLASSVGIGNIFVGAIYKDATSNTYLPYFKESDYRYGLSSIGVSYNDTNEMVSYTVYSYLPLSHMFVPMVSYNLVGGYFAFDMEEFIYLNAEGGIIRQTEYSATTNITYNNIYVNGGVLFKAIEGSKYEVGLVMVMPDNESNISLMGGDIKGFLNYYVPLLTDEDEIKVLFKVGLRNISVSAVKIANSSIVGVANVGYNAGNLSFDLLGYLNKSDFSMGNSISTNFTFGDVRLYVGYNIASLIRSKELGKDLWLKVGGRGVVQTGNVNVGNVGESTIITPYIGIWYTIPKVDSYIVISYGWYGATSTRDIDLGRGLESTVIMYNGVNNWSGGLATSDNMGYVVLPDGKVVNLGEYKLATEPTIRFDLYIRY